MKLRLRKLPLVDLEYNGIHLSRLPVATIGPLFNDGINIEDRVTALKSMFATGALCDQHGNKFGDLSDLDDFRNAIELLRKLSGVVADLGKSPATPEE